MSNVIEFSSKKPQPETSSDEASRKQQLKSSSNDRSSDEDWDVKMQRIRRSLVAINDLMAQFRR